jgi:hypothetical protein
LGSDCRVNTHPDLPARLVAGVCFFVIRSFLLPQFLVVLKRNGVELQRQNYQSRQSSRRRLRRLVAVVCHSHCASTPASPWLEGTRQAGHRNRGPEAVADPCRLKLLVLPVWAGRVCPSPPVWGGQTQRRGDDTRALPSTNNVQMHRWLTGCGTND